MLIDSHTLLFLGGSVLRIDELEINPALKLISYDRREEGEMSRKISSLLPPRLRLICSQAIVESVPEMRLSDDVAGVGRIRLQFDTQTTHNSLDVVGRIAILRAPHPLQKQVGG